MLTERLWYLDHPTQAQHQHPMCGCAHCRSVHRYEKADTALSSKSGVSRHSVHLSSNTSSDLLSPAICCIASATRSCPSSEETVQGLKFGSVLQNPCKRGQNGKFCSSWAVHLSVPWHLQQMQCLPILFDSSEPSAIFSTFKPAPVWPMSLLNSRYLVFTLVDALNQ